MKTSFWLLFVFVMTVPITALAGNESLVFFDLKVCKSGTAENEPLTGNSAYEQWVKKADGFNGGSNADSISKWSVFYTSESKMGICKTIFSATQSIMEISCREEALNGFELAGAKYTGLRNKAGALLRFKCASGCKATTPEFLYREIESDDDVAKGPDEIELLNAYREYDRMCKSK